MNKKTVIIIVAVVVAVLAATGLAVLIWWLLTYGGCGDGFCITRLEGDGVGSARYTAAFTRIHNVGRMFWWFYPTTAAANTSRPLLVWLDGLTGVPPSLLANFIMLGPYDFNLNERNNSWVEEYNLLFVDAPLGTGFSMPDDVNKYPTNLDENAGHLVVTLNAFYKIHNEYSDTPLYIVGQGTGAQLALSLAIQLSDVSFSHNLRGVVLANGVISPALALTKLGMYMEELGYIDYVGRAAIENLSTETSSLVNQERYADAFNRFLNLGAFVNINAQAVAVNLRHIVEKLTRTTAREFEVPDYFGQKTYLRSLSPQDLYSFMENTVAHALGIHDGFAYDGGQQQAINAVRDTFMIPAVDKVEYVLQNTDIKVVIYNGNLDAVSNTPGQLEWVDNLQWSGQQEFRDSPRQTLVVNRLVEGYFRETSRLQFYWMNAAGQWVPLDSPTAMRRVMQRITEN